MEVVEVGVPIVSLQKSLYQLGFPFIWNHVTYSARDSDPSLCEHSFWLIFKVLDVRACGHIRICNLLVTVVVTLSCEV